MALGEVRLRRQRAVEESKDRVEMEHEAFVQKLPTLLRRYEGRFVALYQGRVIGHDQDDEELGRRMYERLGEVPFYIAKVERTPTVYELPSPEVVR